jgi:hypothetical protein
MNLDNLFPDEDYHFQVRFDRGTAATFFAPTAAHANLLQERQAWLRDQPAMHAALLPEAGPLLGETLKLAQTTGTLSDVSGSPSWLSDSSLAGCLELGRHWEPDFLLLRSDPELGVRLLGGCVCFPSSWSLTEKIGKPIEAIHDVVPGLNQSIGPQIHTFLSRLRPGIAWLRANWGLSRSRELNQHPARRLPALDADVSLEEVWLRIEQQALLALPDSGGILFGIRIEVHSLTGIRQDRSLASRVARAIRSLPEPMARYKNISTARDSIVRFLTD